MADHAELKLTLRLVPADDRPANPIVLDDIVRLIRQALVTAPKDSPQIIEPAEGFREPNGDENRTITSLVSKIESRIQQSSAASQAAVERRARTANEPDGQEKLRAETLDSAARVVSAVLGAILKRVRVSVPDAT